MTSRDAAEKRAIQATQDSLTRITQFCKQNNFQLADVYPWSYCFRIIFPRRANMVWMGVSLSRTKMVEWRDRDPNTTVVEIALWNTTTGVTYDAAAGYDDVCLFENMDKALDEVLRLDKFFEP